MSLLCYVSFMFVCLPFLLSLFSSFVSAHLFACITLRSAVFSFSLASLLYLVPAFSLFLLLFVRASAFSRLVDVDAFRPISPLFISLFRVF